MSYRTWFLITYAMDTPKQNLKIVRPTCAPFWKLIRVSKCAKSNNLSFRVKKIRLRHDPPTQSWKPPKQSDFTRNQFKLVPWCERKRMPKSFFITLLSDFRFCWVIVMVYFVYSEMFFYSKRFCWKPSLWSTTKLEQISLVYHLFPFVCIFEFISIRASRFLLYNTVS